MGSNFLIVHNAVQEVIDLVDEGMLPANDMPMRPPILPPGVVSFRDQDIVEALGLFRFFIDPEYL